MKSPAETYAQVEGCEPTPENLREGVLACLVYIDALERHAKARQRLFWLFTAPLLSLLAVAVAILSVVAFAR